MLIMGMRGRKDSKMTPQSSEKKLAFAEIKK